MGSDGNYLLVFLVALVAAYLLVFPVRSLAARFGAVAQPSLDRVHARPTPTAGGSALFIAFVIAMAVAATRPGFSSIFEHSSQPLGVILAGLVAYLVGLVDDLRDISAPAKVAGQVLAAMVLVFLGVTMYYFKLPFVSGIGVLSPSVLPLVTALWVVGMANAVNLIDGLDGLAAGIVAIAAGTLCIYGLHLVSLGDLPDTLGPLVAVIACGVCVGFLPHNFHPAKVFMGDSGALFLGLLMAAATMLTGGRTANSTGGIDVSGLTFFRFAPLFIPFFILGVPILDTAFAIVRRTLRRTSVSERDLGHLHHRLIRLGHGHRRAVLILWAWTAVLSGFVLLPSFDQQANAFVPIGAAVLGVGLYTVFRPGRGEARRVAPVGPGTLEAPREVRDTPTGRLPVVVSGAAGVAVAGERDLTSPARRFRRRILRHRRPAHQRGSPRAGKATEAGLRGGEGAGGGQAPG